MKHKETIDLLTSLQKVKGVDSFKVNYAVQKNIGALKKEVEILSKQEQEIMEIKKDFEAERIKLCEEFSMVDGKPQFNPDGTYKIARQDQFTEKFLELKEKHKDALEDFDKKHKEFVAFLIETDSDFKPFLISINDIPENLSTENTVAIFPLIKEE